MESLANNVTNTGDMQWEYRQVSVTRVPGYGFGIAVSGGRDNPHFSSGDPSIAVSDVLAHGPAERLLQVNDRILSVNGVSLLNVDYATAVQVLRDSGDTVVLSVKRRAPPPSPGAPTRITLTRAGKKDDFGIVIGCKLFVKEISSKARDQLALSNQHLQEGDIVTRLHNTSCGDTMSLKEARKIMDSCKERLSLVVTRPQPNTPPGKFDTNGDRNVLDEVAGPPLGYSQQNLYVQPPTRHQRGPSNQSHHENHSGIEPPRPPPPRVDALMNPGRSPYDEDPLVTRRGVGVAHHPRLIAFQKEGSVGIRLTGGNRAGIFVTAVQPGSPASLQGLQPGDKILKVNDMDMAGVTREEAVLFLLGLQDRIELTVQLCKDEYDGAVAAQQGDSFYIKAHFHYETPAKGEMSFRAGDVFHVVDTLYNGVVGCWQVFRVGRNNQEVQKGIIPNKARAEELATAQFNASKKDGASGESRGSFFRRRRPQHRRSKSLGKEHWDDILFSDGTSKFPAYERVVLRHPGFVRPIVLFGAIADIARDKLLRDFPDQFVSPQSDNETNSSSKGGAPHIIRLSAIRDVMATGKHALLDVTPAAVERLNYAQLYPIAVLLRADSKLVVKQLRQGLPKTAHRSSKKLLEQSARLERSWGHLLSATIPLSDASDHWYRKLREILDRHQAAALWTAETKGYTRVRSASLYLQSYREYRMPKRGSCPPPEEGLSDDFLFPMSSLRLSYASSPESDLEHSPGRGARLHRASSDPSVATAEPPTTPSAVPPPPYRPAAPASPNHGSPHGPADGKYGFSSLQPPPSHHHHQQDLDQESPILNGNGHHHGMSAIYGVGHERQRSGLYVHAPAPDLPPRIDRAVKPSGSTGLLAPAPARQSRSAHERLFPAKPPPNQSSPLDMNNDQSNYHHLGNFINNSSRNGSSLERRQDTSKLISYDSMSSYDSYSNHPQQRNSNNNNANTHGHHHASPKRYLGPNAHDDLKRHLVVETRTDYGRYKPVPPPKPKHYRPPLQGDDGAGYYYNVPEPRGAADGAHLPPRPHPPPPHVPRASAFELYRKPTTQYR